MNIVAYLCVQRRSSTFIYSVQRYGGIGRASRSCGRHQEREKHVWRHWVLADAQRYISQRPSVSGMLVGGARVSWGTLLAGKIDEHDHDRLVQMWAWFVSMHSLRSGYKHVSCSPISVAMNCKSIKESVNKARSGAIISVRNGIVSEYKTERSQSVSHLQLVQVPESWP